MDSIKHQANSLNISPVGHIANNCFSFNRSPSKRNSRRNSKAALSNFKSNLIKADNLDQNIFNMENNGCYETATVCDFENQSVCSDRFFNNDDLFKEEGFWKDGNDIGR